MGFGRRNRRDAVGKGMVIRARNGFGGLLPLSFSFSLLHDVFSSISFYFLSLYVLSISVDERPGVYPDGILMAMRTHAS